MVNHKQHSHNNRQGQVTIFVMIGLLLLVIVGLGLFMLGGDDNITTQTGRVDTTQVVTYVESCLRQTAKDGLLLLGRQGGYTDLTGMSYNEEMPWLGQAYVGGPQVIPYWYYVASCDNPYGCVEFAPPPLCKDATECDYAGDNSIELQLEHYVAQNIDVCLGEFTPLKDRFGIARDGDARVDIVFTPNDIIVDLLRPLEVEDYVSNEQVSISQFSSRLDVDFEEVYRLAYDIAELQYYTNFVENNFLHFLSIFQGDPPNPPPFTSQEFFGGNKMWLRSEVQQTLEDEILPYLNFMQIVNAGESYSPIVYFGDLDPEDPYTPFAQGIYLYSELNLGAGKSYPDLGATFLYPYDEIFLNINNRELLKGEKIKADNFAMKLAGLLITTYDFKYDVAWPLITTVSAPKAFGGEGYEFSFGIEGNVINNLPYSFDRAIIPGPVSQGLVDLSDPQHHTQSTVTITVKDKLTNEPLPDMSLSYDCGWNIHIGITGSEGIWLGTLPYCPVGGLLVAETTPHYYMDSKPHNSDRDGLVYNYELDMWPIKEKEITILRRTADDLANATTMCSNPDNCRDWLAWGELLHYSLLVDENGSSVYNETDECVTNNSSDHNNSSNGSNASDSSVCALEERTLPFSQYAMLMIQREQGVGELDPLPLTNMFTFGKSLENVAIQNQLQGETINQLFADGSLTQEQHDMVLQEMERETNLSFELEKYRTVEMIPGKYDVEAFLFYTGNIQIPAETRKEGGFLTRTTIHLPAMNFTTWLQGGVKFKAENALTFTPEQIYSDKPLVIYVLEQPLPYSWKTFEKFTDLNEYQETYSNYAQPEFETLPDPLN